MNRERIAGLLDRFGIKYSFSAITEYIIHIEEDVFPEKTSGKYVPVFLDREDDVYYFDRYPIILPAEKYYNLGQYMILPEDFLTDNMLPKFYAFLTVIKEDCLI